MVLKQIFKIWSFISAILLITDMVFDGLQCKTYHDFAYDEEAEAKIKISKWYFICSVAIWAGPPICLIIFWFTSYFIDPNYGESWYLKTKSGNSIVGSFTRPPWDKRDLGPNQVYDQSSNIWNHYLSSILSSILRSIIF